MTGLLSPDPDAHVLRGALVYGSVRGAPFPEGCWGEEGSTVASGLGLGAQPRSFSALVSPV